VALLCDFASAFPATDKLITPVAARIKHMNNAGCFFNVSISSIELQIGRLPDLG